MEKINRPAPLGKLRLYVAAVFIAYLYHLVRYADQELWNSIYSVYYVLLIPALITLHFSLRGFRGLTEERLFVLYWAWVFVSRLLNGDFFLTNDADMVINLGLACVFLSVCLVLERPLRQRFLDWICTATAAYYTLLCIPAMYAVLYRKELFNPLTGSQLCGFEGTISRLTMFYKSSNEITLWFFISFFLLVYLFCRSKNIFCRIPIVLAAVLNYLALSMTFSRNGMLAFSFGVGLLAGAIAMRYMKRRELGRKILVSALLFCLFTAGAYFSFDVSAAVVRRASDAVLSVQSQTGTEDAEILSENETADTDSEQTETAAEKDSAAYIDDRSLLDDSERFMIYESIIPTMQQEPMRLLRGCLCKDVMSIANEVMPKTRPHYHNSYLQALNITGLPGLALLLAFSVLLVVKIIRLYFSSAPLELKSFLIILTGIFFYNLLETSLFVAADIRAFIFYILAGAILAGYREYVLASGRKEPPADH